MGRALGLVVVIALTGCAVAIPLPAHGGGLACRGIGLDAVLRGHPVGPNVVWLEHRETGERLDVRVRWPPGSVARFAPEVEVVLESGRVLYAEGDIVSGGCRGADMDTVNIVPGA